LFQREGKNVLKGREGGGREGETEERQEIAEKRGEGERERERGREGEREREREQKGRKREGKGKREKGTREEN
jgi:hypothetical protein